jgi:hypothetical protein
LPEVDGDKPKRSRFKAYPLGYFHIDLAEVHTAEGRLYLRVAIDRTIKDATVKRYRYDSHAQLRAHLADFVSTYTFARRLKTLRGLTPYEVSRPTRLSAKHGPPSLAASTQTRSTKCRD